jgi:formylglycine-generating enzyme required for sulfatase activity
VVHRDLKPANLMLDRHEEVRITDFGISASVSESVTRESRVAASLGSPPYMSPQQAMSELASASDDVYALGATLYELVTAKPPFYAGNIVMQVLNKVPPSLASRREELGVSDSPIPEAWEKTLAACLAKDPADRPTSGGEVAACLLGPARAQVAGAAAPKVDAIVPDRVEGRGRRGGGLAALPLFGALGVWYFGVRPPAQSRAAQERVEAAYRLTEAGRTEQERTTVQEEQAERERAATLRKQRGPVAGQPTAIPDLGLDLVWIDPGSFTMGAPSSEAGRLDNEGPQTQVTLTEGYWLGKTEVTQGQWEAVMGNDPCLSKGANRPVEQVSWTGTVEFCRKLTERERTAGHMPEGYAYALPTEAQWEYACRAGTTGSYGGDGNLGEMGWYGENSGSETKPVVLKRANTWGLYDMHGNVWEWTASRFGSYPSGSVRNYVGSNSGSCRVYRGGSWSGIARSCRSAFRFRAPRSTGVTSWAFASPSVQSNEA